MSASCCIVLPALKRVMSERFCVSFVSLIYCFRDEKSH